MSARVHFDFSGLRVLVTGGSSGIGLGIAAAFADAGAAVTITGRRASASEYESDLSRFAPHEEQELAETCVSRALQLVEQLEARRVVTEPPALPIAT